MVPKAPVSESALFLAGYAKVARDNDATEFRSAQSMLQSLSHFDDLTGSDR